MENACKPTIEEKHYSYSRSTETNVKNDTPKAEVRHIDCPKKNGFGFMKKPEEPPPPQLLEKGPPLYPDLGKKANDVFGRGYHLGLLKLDIKTKTTSGVEFSTGGNSNQETGKLSGSLETKYKVKDYGITFTEKWDTGNVMATDVAIKDKLVDGLKLAGNINFSAVTGFKSGCLKAVFVNKTVAAVEELNMNPDSSSFKSSIVAIHQGWRAGLQGIFDVDNTTLTKAGVALGFSTTDFIVHSCIENEPEKEDGQEFSGSIYHKISPKLEAGIQVAWTPTNNDTKFGIGFQYEVDKDASVRAKINNAALIGLGYQQRLHEGITLTLSALIDAKNFSAGGHKLGLALELEA